MHHNRLHALVIDCCVDDQDAAATFRSRVLGKLVANADPDGDGRYAERATAADELAIQLQKLNQPSRCIWTSKPTIPRPTSRV
jgi:hypothetical protein